MFILTLWFIALTAKNRARNMLQMNQKLDPHVVSDSQPSHFKRIKFGPTPILPTHVQKRLPNFVQPLCTWTVTDGRVVGDARWPQSGWRSSGCTRQVFTAARGEKMHGQRPVTTCSGPRVHRRAVTMGNKWTRAGMRGGTILLAPLSSHSLDPFFFFFFFNYHDSAGLLKLN